MLRNELVSLDETSDRRTRGDDHDRVTLAGAYLPSLEDEGQKRAGGRGRKWSKEKRERDRRKKREREREFASYWPGNLPGGTHIQIMVMIDRFPLRRSLSPLFLLVDGTPLSTVELFSSNCS